MQCLDVFAIQVGSTQCRTGGGGGDEVHPLSYAVHNHHDSIVAIRIWQFRDEVYGNHALPFLGNRKRVQLTHWCLTGGLGPEAHVTSAGVGINIA